MDPTALIISVFYSIIGIAYISYGKKKDIYFAVCGIALLVFPYFITHVWTMLLTGIGFMVLPFLLTRFIPL